VNVVLLSRLCRFRFAVMAERTRPKLQSFDSNESGLAVSASASASATSNPSKGGHSSPMSWEEMVADHQETFMPHRQISAASQSIQASPRSLERLQSKSSHGDASRSRRGSVMVGGEFIKTKSSLKVHHKGHKSCWEGFIELAETFQQSKYVSNFMVVAVLFDAYCTCSDIDARAAGNPKPEVLLLMSDLCLILYTLELVLAALTRGLRMIVQDWTILLDIVIILCGYSELALTAIAGDNTAVAQLGVLRALRLVRIVRLMRLLRRTRALRELQKLVHMMATCMKALGWSFFFCFLIMTVWAMLMVEVIHPLITEMVRDGETFEDCDQCTHAARSVMDANLLLFKTVIAGDSWGRIAVPVIENFPATALIFVGSQATLVFGVLNLIVAVVVDTFAEARQRDILNLAEELEYDSEKDKRFLQKIFERMDENNNGQVTYEELLECARRDAEFQSRLRVMDIDEDDLRQLFEMIDTTGEGTIKADEFIAPLSRWVHDSKTAPRFIKYNLMRALEQQEELYIFCQDYFDNLGSRMDFLAHALKKMYENNTVTSLGPEPGDVQKESFDLPEKTENSGLTEFMECQSEVGSRASDNADEVVEQPHLSKKPTLKVDPNQVVKSAMENLESCVLRATESALRSSLADVESSLREQLHTTIPDINLQVSKRGRSFPRMSQFQRMRQEKLARSSSHSGSSLSFTASVALSSQVLDSKVLDSKDRPRRPIGTFGKPKRRDGARESPQDAPPTPLTVNRKASKESDTRPKFVARSLSRAKSLAIF